LRKKIKGPSIEVIDTASLCYLDKEPQESEHDDTVRSAFVLGVGVGNPRDSDIVVKTFMFAYRRRQFWGKYAKKLGPCTLPNIPRKEMGAGTKYLAVWFSRFPGSTDDLVVNARIQDKGYSEGYLLFVSNTYGSWNPEELDGKVEIEVTAVLTSGERVKARSKIRIWESMEEIEKLIPDLGDQVRHQSSWNIPAK